MRRAMIFIDGSNMYFDWQATASTGKHMDLEKLIKTIISKFPDIELKRTYYFITKTGDISQQPFLDKIKHIEYMDIKFGRLQNKTIDLSKFNLKCSCGANISNRITTKVDKGTDVNLAVEMILHAFNHSYDVAILISRDADFVRVVQIVKDTGANVELVLFDGAKDKARELSENVDRRVIITQVDCDNSAQ